MTRKPTKRASEHTVRPTCPARRAAARLRRAFWRPILAAPPVRAIQVSPLLRSDDRKGRIALNYELKLVYKEKNHWLVLTRTSLAGFNAPIDNNISGRMRWSPFRRFLDAVYASKTSSPGPPFRRFSPTSDCRLTSAQVFITLLLWFVPSSPRNTIHNN